MKPFTPPIHAWKQRPVVLLLGLLVVSLLAAGWAYQQLSVQYDAARAAASDWSHAEHVGEQIRQLRLRPVIAGEQELQQAELAKRIESAARGAQMSSTQVVRIWPETARRVGQTSYKEKPTQLLLRSMTLRQLVTFLQALSVDPVETAPAVRGPSTPGESAKNNVSPQRPGAGAGVIPGVVSGEVPGADGGVNSARTATGAGGLQVRALRLTAPREQERYDIWTVEVTLSSYIFDPPTGRDASISSGGDKDL